MPYRLGVDVGGTFTDLILVDEKSGSIHTAKVPSTPADSSIGVMNGVAKVCDNAGVDPSEIAQVMHGTTVATNTVLTGTGARVGLVTTKGYKQVLQIARSYVPGGLGGWVIYNKSQPLAPLSCTIEADERMGADGAACGCLLASPRVPRAPRWPFWCLLASPRGASGHPLVRFECVLGHPVGNFNAFSNGM